MNQRTYDTNLIWLKTPEKLEIEKYLKEINAKRNLVAELTLALEDVESEVKRFETEYNAIVGKLYVELDKVNLEIKEYAHRIQLIEKETIFNKTKIDAKVEEAFKDERQKISEYEQKAEQDSREFENQKTEHEIDKATVKQLRKLYLKLAKIYHPDKAKTDEERNRNERMMSLINRAYEEKDVLTLQRLVKSAKEEEDIPNETPAEKRIRLQKENRKLDEVIADLKREIEKIKSTETYNLKTKVERARKRGEDILGKLAKDVMRKIDAGRRKLDGLIQRFRRLSELLGFA